ncbi:CDP-diacylglycerol--serine O-phosphatidyltransferase [Klebsiella pneumoniae]|uniref:CDP-diacylglycerol--serine O-phosphatidyltransferase n=1 Tax=Klebsiella pneumoniae TaxID=573 RepID=A0A2X3IQ89_KLEPN|nr:CDP-diacylglycerol--serine O-phosphatidyltransferase [Klebsiella pneumoniae]
MLSKFKRNKHQQHLAQLPKLSQSVDDVEFFYAPAEFREALLTRIAHATQRICIIALYLEQDDGGKGILQALYDAKRQRPELDVRVLVDWHALSVAVSAPPPLIPMPTGIVGWPMKIQG